VNALFKFQGALFYFKCVYMYCTDFSEMKFIVTDLLHFGMLAWYRDIDLHSKMAPILNQPLAIKKKCPE